MSKASRTGWIYLLSDDSDAGHLKVGFSSDHPEDLGKKPELNGKANDFKLSSAFLFADRACKIDQMARDILEPHQKDAKKGLYACKLEDAKASIIKAAKQLEQEPVASIGNDDADDGTAPDQDDDCPLKSAKIAARHGDADAQFFLGASYADGEGVTKDEKEAFRWYRKAAEREHLDAQDSLGVCYDHGKGVKEDHIQAALWFTKAAKQGHASAQMNLGNCYYNGRGVKKDLEEATNWWLKAAEKGHASAQYNLGLCYSKGRGVKEDHKQAANWYLKAAKQDLAEAQATLAKCYLEGTGVSKNPGEAKDWMKKALAADFEDTDQLLEKILEERASSYRTAIADSDRLSLKPSMPEIMAIINALDDSFPEWDQDDNAHYQLIENLHDNFKHLR